LRRLHLAIVEEGPAQLPLKTSLVQVVERSALAAKEV